MVVDPVVVKPSVVKVVGVVWLFEFDALVPKIELNSIVLSPEGCMGLTHL